MGPKLFIVLALVVMSLSQPCWAKVELSELLPKPSQGEEWVELYNDADTAVNLTNWQLWDELSQPTLIYSFTTETILPHSWLVVPINRKLNDSGDGVSLKNATGQVIDFTHYDNAPSDLSWTRTSSTDWFFTTASPGLANPIPTPTPQPTLTPTPTLIPTSMPKPTTPPTATPTLHTTANPTSTPTSSANTTSNKTVSSSTSASSALTPFPSPTFTNNLQKIIAQAGQSAGASSSLTSPLPSPQMSSTATQASSLTSDLFSAQEQLTPLKIAAWINAIMMALTIKNIIIVSYFLRRCYLTHESPFSSLSHRLDSAPSLN